MICTNQGAFMLIEVFSVSYCLDDVIALTRQNEISVGFAFSRNVSATQKKYS